VKISRQHHAISSKIAVVHTIWKDTALLCAMNLATEPRPASKVEHSDDQATVAGATDFRARFGLTMSTQALMASNAMIGGCVAAPARLRARTRSLPSRHACAAVVCSASAPAKEYHVLAKAEIPAHLPRCAQLCSACGRQPLCGVPHAVSAPVHDPADPTF